jgi:hypothetical protein
VLSAVYVFIDSSIPADDTLSASVHAIVAAFYAYDITCNILVWCLLIAGFRILRKRYKRQNHPHTHAHSAEFIMSFLGLVCYDVMSIIASVSMAADYKVCSLLLVYFVVNVIYIYFQTIFLISAHMYEKEEPDNGLFKFRNICLFLSVYNLGI